MPPFVTKTAADDAVITTQVSPRITGFDITTSCELFSPERLFAIVHELNQAGGLLERVGIEVYPTRHSPLTPVSVERILGWQKRYDAKVVRVHIEFAYDQAEIRHIISRADQCESVLLRLQLRALHWVMADASAGLGVALARGLGVGVNVHSSVIASLALHGRLAEFSAGLPFVWAENNMNADHLYARGPVLYNPLTIVDEQVERYGLEGLLLGLDHLIQHHPEQHISPYRVLDDERVHQWTRAIHVAGKGHSILHVGDRMVEQLLVKVARTPFHHPVRLVLDYSPFAVLGYAFKDEVRLFRDTFDWISRLLNAVEGCSGEF
jgi:hypothetical protein